MGVSLAHLMLHTFMCHRFFGADAALMSRSSGSNYNYIVNFSPNYVSYT